MSKLQISKFSVKIITKLALTHVNSNFIIEKMESPFQLQSSNSKVDCTPGTNKRARGK